MTNFLNMTDAQLRVFEQIAANKDLGHNIRTVDALLRKGYIEKYWQRPVGRFTGLYITRYKVPLSIHIDWCEWCGEQMDEE